MAFNQASDCQIREENKAADDVSIKDLKEGEKAEKDESNDDQELADEVIDLGYNLFDQQPMLFEEEIEEIERDKKKKAKLVLKRTKTKQLSLIE